MFHEFGHALHGLELERHLSDIGRHCGGPRLRRVSFAVSGALALDAGGVAAFCASLPDRETDSAELWSIEIKRSATFNQGFTTVEYLIAALVDMKLHLAGDRKIDADAFEKETLAQLGMPKEIVMRHRMPHFVHIFSSDAYSAGYYSYLWSDVLTADAFGAFVEGKGPYDRTVAERLRKNIFSVGNTIDPAEGYQGVPRPRSEDRCADEEARFSHNRNLSETIDWDTFGTVRPLQNRARFCNGR